MSISEEITRLEATLEFIDGLPERTESDMLWRSAVVYDLESCRETLK